MHHVVSLFPICEHTLCCFASHLAEEGLAPQTVKSYLSAVRNFQLSLGLPDTRYQSSLPVLKRVLAGISRAYADRNKATPRSLSRSLPEYTTRYSCLRARRAPSSGPLLRLPSLGFSAWASCWWYHPAVNLSWGNTAVDNSSFPTMVRIHLRRSKCDQFGRGVDVVIARTGTSLCPVTAIVNYLYVHQDRPGAFFCLRDGTPVSMPWFIAKIRHPVFHLPSTSRLWLGLGSERQHWRVWRTLPFRPWAMAECSFSAVHPHPSGLPSHTEWQRQEFFRPLLQTKSAIYPPHAYTVLGETNYYNYPWGF